MNSNRSINIIKWGFIALFCGILYLPVADNIFHLSPAVKFSENRTLSSFPQLPSDWAGIFPFCAQFEVFFKDHFGFRPLLIQAHTIYKTKLLRESPNKKVIVGHDDWLYFTGEDEGLLRYDNHFSREELQKIAISIEARKRWTSQNGALFFLFIAPNKQSIYPEFLPQPQKDWMANHNLYDQLLSFVAGRPAEEILIDVKGSMLQEKKAGKVVYFKTDSHWNPLSAWLAYQMMMKKISSYFPSVEPKSLNDFTLIENLYSGDLVTVQLGIDKLFQETASFLAPRYTPTAVISEFATEYDGEELKFPIIVSQQAQYGPSAGADKKSVNMKVLVLRDSQFIPIIPWFAETFGKVIFINYWEKNDCINRIIAKEKPDIVIHEMVERNIRALPLFVPPN